MNYTRQTPPEGGYYWYKEKAGHRARILQVITSDKEDPIVVFMGTRCYRMLEKYDGWWAGPLSEPEPPVFPPDQGP